MKMNTIMPILLLISQTGYAAVITVENKTNSWVEGDFENSEHVNLSFAIDPQRPYTISGDYEVPTATALAAGEKSPTVAIKTIITGIKAILYDSEKKTKKVGEVTIPITFPTVDTTYPIQLAITPQTQKGKPTLGTGKLTNLPVQQGQSIVTPSVPSIESVNLKNQPTVPQRFSEKISSENPTGPVPTMPAPVALGTSQQQQQVPPTSVSMPGQVSGSMPTSTPLPMSVVGGAQIAAPQAIPLPSTSSSNSTGAMAPTPTILPMPPVNNPTPAPAQPVQEAPAVVGIRPMVQAGTSTPSTAAEPSPVSGGMGAAIAALSGNIPAAQTTPATQPTPTALPGGQAVGYPTQPTIVPIQQVTPIP